MRRGFLSVLIALAVLGVSAGAVVRASRPRRVVVSIDKEPAHDPTLPAGYWVWSRSETPFGTLDITPSDLGGRVGPTGWPGCPDNYLCTRHGVRTLAIGPTGGFHYIANVFTSSDFQHHGSVSGDAVHIDERFSCAHPDWRSAPRESRRIVWRRRGDVLRVAIDPSVRGGGWPFAEYETGSWWTFRAISRAAYYARMIRLCQPTRTGACAPMCFSDQLVGAD